ncbi:hypothetical protein ACWCPF_05535 [Streptomyces sp. NPDC001858]
MTTHVLVTEAGARLAVIACALRNTGSGWAVIGGSAHQPSAVTGVETNADHIELQHAVGATHVVTMSVTVDETFARSGLRAGPSAGLALSRIELYAGAADTPALDPADVVSATGNLWVSGLLLLPAA